MSLWIDRFDVDVTMRWSRRATIDSVARPRPDYVPPKCCRMSRRTGRPLDKAMRRETKSLFRVDLGDVRVPAEAEAEATTTSQSLSKACGAERNVWDRSVTPSG
jgi:hypothetical protein